MGGGGGVSSSLRGTWEPLCITSIDEKLEYAFKARHFGPYIKKNSPTHVDKFQLSCVFVGTR